LGAGFLTLAGLRLAASGFFAAGFLRAGAFGFAAFFCFAIAGLAYQVK
jgi:hypothetical protein